MRQEYSLKLKQEVKLTDGGSLRLNEVIFETIEANPQHPKSSPGGSGVTAYLEIKSAKGDYKKISLEQLSAGYKSKDRVTEGQYKIHLVKTNESYQDPVVTVSVEIEK